MQNDKKNSRINKKNKKEFMVLEQIDTFVFILLGLKTKIDFSGKWENVIYFVLLCILHIINIFLFTTLKSVLWNNPPLLQ